jgi:hypothetical protein
LAASIKSSSQETAAELEKESFLEKLRASSFLKRAALLALLLTSTETLGQDKHKFETSVESAKKAVEKIDRFTRAKPDREGIKTFTRGVKTNFFEKKINGSTIHTNDAYLYLKKEIKNEDGFRTEYGLDLNKDGTVDQIALFLIRSMMPNICQ